jgi:hypothetical protein
MQLTRLAAAALFALAPCLMAPARAYAVTEADFAAKTAGDLVNLCAADPKEPMGTAALNFCHGFAQGAVSVVMEEAAASKRARFFCFPTPAPSRTATLAEFVTWARANPSHLSETPADGLFAFLRQRFPCGKP